MSREARVGDRRPYIYSTPAGQKVFSKLSKADFADVATSFAMGALGREISPDQAARILESRAILVKRLGIAALGE